VNQTVELMQDKGWSRESNVQVLVVKEMEDDTEVALLNELLGPNILLINKNIIRLEGRKGMFVVSNTKNYLIKPQ